MTAIDPVATSAAQAFQAGQAATATGVSDTQKTASGLPPVNLARAASANTVNAELAASQWGIDPATVSGVYGGAAASDSGGLFSGDTLLPLLTTLTHANAEQALSLIGVKTPTPGGGSGAATAATVTTLGANTAAAATNSQSALAQAAYSSSSPVVVDPLWGRSA